MSIAEAWGVMGNLKASKAAAQEAPPAAKFTSAVMALKFVLSGNAHFTARSVKTGTRFTYRAEKSRELHGPTFVSVLTGPDYYEFLGVTFDGKTFKLGRKSRLSANAPSAITFCWLWLRLQKGLLHEQLELWHEGRCGKCSRLLTDPASIESGVGPVFRGRQ
jgi:hypothetical protein